MTSATAVQCWSLPEVAARLNISLRGLRRLIEAGQIATLRVGPGRITITEAALERFVAEHEQVFTPGGTPQPARTNVMKPLPTLDRPSLDRP